MPFLKDLAAQFNELLAQQTTTRKLFALVVLIGVVGLLAAQIFRVTGTTEWEVLYADLNTQQAKLVKDELTRAGQQFRTSKSREGWIVRVPEGAALDWRLELAQKVEAEGMGKGWDLFDPKEFGITSEEFKVKRYRALRGELSRTISRMEMIKSAVVELALPREEIFAKDEKPAKASVLVSLYPDVALSRSQVETIQSLVAGSVEGLLPENVTVADTRGNELSRLEKPDTMKAALDNRERLLGIHKRKREEYEEYLENKILAAFAPIFGPGHVRANVSVEYDFTEKQENATKYDPNPVPVSSAFTRKGTGVGKSHVLGVTGAARHIQNVSELTTAGLVGSEWIEEEIANYEVGFTELRTIHAPYVIRRISVGLVVDDKPTSVTRASDGTMRVIARRPLDRTELRMLESTVKGIVNYSEERPGGISDEVVVTNIPFTPVGEPEPAITLEKLEMQKRTQMLIRYGFLFAIVLLALLFVVKPLLRIIAPRPVTPSAIAGPAEMRALVEAERAALEEAPMPPSLAGAALEPGALPQPTGEAAATAARISSLDDEILELARTNPKKVPLVLRSWMES